MPWCPHSTAIVAVRLSTPALAAPYWPVIGHGCEPLRDEMFTIDPPRPIISRAAACAAKNVHFRFRSTTASHCDSVRSISGPTSEAFALPALFTQQSIAPNSSSVALDEPADAVARS